MVSLAKQIYIDKKTSMFCTQKNMSEL